MTFAHGTLDIVAKDRTSDRERFRRDVLEGLSRTPKVLPPKWFYDREGSRLFDEICELPEYYVTRAELSILARDADAIVERWGDHVRIVEPGAGSCTKTRHLLAALGARRCASYVPVDISRDHLVETAARVRRELPWLDVEPVALDFVADALPSDGSPGRTVVYFPGSTLGNFEPREAEDLLRRFRRAAGRDGIVVLGIDLRKDPAALHAAYNDARGVTAAFNKNVLARMNHELGGDVDPSSFWHYAFYAPRESRVEMHLVSQRAQTVRVAGARFRFDDGESIRTECSQKYDLASADRLARLAGLRRTATWTDEERRFAILELRPDEGRVHDKGD